MATINQQTSWKDQAINRSTAITDAWEVTKAYAGRIAEWVLFFCMIINIIEILPGVYLWGWLSNAVLGVQAVTLDVAGFGLATMAEHARENGNFKAAKRATVTSFFLIGLMIVTLLLVSLGLLWPDLKQFTDPAEKCLILVRVVMTVIYGHVIHTLRRDSSTLAPIPVATVEQRMEEVVANLSSQITEEVAKKSSLLVASAEYQIAQSLATLQIQVANEVANLRTTVASEIAQSLATYVTEDEDEVATPDNQITAQIETVLRTMQGLTSGLAEVRREVRTTVTEIRSITQETPVVPATLALPQLATTVDSGTEERSRVFGYLQSCGSQKPTLQQIMDICKVAKKTATKYRREYYELATGSQSEDEE